MGLTGVPYVFTVEEMVDHFMDAEGWPTSADVEEAGARLGRNSYPALVHDLYLEGLLTAEAAQVAVPSAWSDVEFPNKALSADEWRHLFGLAGYTADGRPAARPAEPQRLYRGADHAHRLGWSWTDDLAVAQWFAERPAHRTVGRVWTVLAPPGALLARITQQRQGESEYVVDAETLADHVRPL